MQLDNSEDDKYEGRTKSEDALYVIVNRRRRRRSRDDRMDGNGEGKDNAFKKGRYI